MDNDLREGLSIKLSSDEAVTLMVHYYRGEMGRMAGWRDRIDRTSNWAITVGAALLSLSLSTPTAHHGVLIFAMLLILLLLVIEARRYRFYDVYRDRVRSIERNYLAPALAEDLAPSGDWRKVLAADLHYPRFRVSGWELWPAGYGEITCGCISYCCLRGF